MISQDCKGFDQQRVESPNVSSSAQYALYRGEEGRDMILPRWDDPIIKLHSVFTEMNIPTKDCQQSRARVSGLLTHEMPSLGAGEAHLLVDIIVSRRTNSKSDKDLT